MLSDIPTLTHIPSISFADDIPEAPLPAPINDKMPGAPAPATLPSDHVCNVINSRPPVEPPPH
jgi:hypothetical protein